MGDVLREGGSIPISPARIVCGGRAPVANGDDASRGGHDGWACL